MTARVRRRPELPAESAEESSAHLLSASVHAALRDRILSGELAPGEPLSVPRLALELDVSRSPVREAVQQLIFERLAVHVPFAGAKVAHIDASTAQDVLAVRELLDGLAARLAAQAMSREDLARLRELLLHQRAAAADPNADVVSLDMQFHAHIARCAGNQPLEDALSRLEALSHAYQRGMWSESGNDDWSLREHAGIADAIAAGDAEAAEAAARRHVAAIRTRLARHRER